MSSESVSVLVERAIDQAFEFAELKKFGAAVNAFALARTLALDMADPLEMRRRLARNVAGFRRERETYRARLATRDGGTDTIVVLSDSLGLPRPDEAAREPHTYSWQLRDLSDGARIDSLCQRFFTTDHVVQTLDENPELGAEADVVVHVGLNDCANRMFLEPERLSLALLPDDLNAKVVEFARKYRLQILRHLPSRHYVPLERFRANLDVIVQRLLQRKAKRVILATIIMPPIRFWRGTPGINANFGRYNHEIMQAASRSDVLLLDIDRLVWHALPPDQSETDSPLLHDGMHLSYAGHSLMARHIVDLLKGKPKPRPR